MSRSTRRTFARKKSNLNLRKRRRTRFESLEDRRLLAFSDFVVNEFLADPAADISGDANGDGTRDGSEDEFIELVNNGPAIDISGWTISDAVGVRHTFPSPTMVAAGQAIVVFGGGTPTGTFGGAVVQTASSGFIGLNNGGDTITLADDTGTATTSLTYPDAATSVPAGNLDQSVTRSPDISGGFDLHSNVTASVLQSPGFEVDGTTPFGGGVVTPTLSISNVTVAEDAGTASFTVTLSPADSGAPVTVEYATSDGSANAPADYTAISSTMLTFAAGETSKTINVSIVDDGMAEPSETFNVDLFNASANAIIGDAQGVGTITDDDTVITPANIWLNEFHYDNASGDVGEFVEVAGPAGTDLTGASIVLYNGSNGQAYDTIALSGVIDNEDGTNGALSFGATGIQNGGPDGIALIDTDGTTVLEFISYEGTMTAGDGPANGMTSTEVADAAGPVSEPGTDDPGLSIQRPTNAAGSLWAAPSAESPGDLNSVVAPTFAISAVNAVQAEGDAGTTAFTFEVTRTGDTSGANDVDFAVSGVADATDFGGALPSGTLNFAAGDATMTVTINVSGDTDVEADEDFTVTLSNATNGASIPAAGDSADGTIQNDDVVTPTFTIAAVNAAQAEGDGGTTAFTFEVTRAGDTSVANDVDYSVSGVADAADFGGTLPSGTLNFAAGETTQTITLDVSGDTDVEADEDFTVELSNPTNGAELGAASSADGTIQNDDAPPTITIWLNEFHYDNTGGDVNEFVEVAGPAGTDLTGASIVLYNGSNGTAYDTIALSGVIDNEDGTNGALSFAPSSSIQNGAPDGIALVNTDGSVIEFISYEGTLTATDGPANGMTSTEVADAAGPVSEPGTDDPGLSIQRPTNAAGSLWAAPSAESPGDLNSVVAPTFAISAVNAVQAEGDAGTTAFTFEVTRSGDTSGANDVDFAVSGVADATDFGGALPSGTLNFAAGETTMTVTINVSGDTDVEADEDFTVTLSNATNGASIPAAGDSADGTIQNDDVVTPTFTIAAVNAVQAEGDGGTTAFTFEVTRAGDTSVANDVNYAVSGDVDAADFGGTLPSGTLNFAAGETTQTITLDVSGDTDVEADEDFTVELSNPTNGAELGAASSADGTIQNDDAPPAITIWLNEFHYDNTGGDVNEFVEVAGPAGTDLTGASIVLYNGSNGTAYDTIALSGVIDNEDGTNGALSFAPSSSIQNGAPDGIALVNTDGSVIEFISYEGTLTATDGPANGMTSTEVADAAGPVSEPGTDDPGLSIQRPTNAAGSLWAAPSAESPGDLNSVVAPTFAISAVNAVQAEGDAGTTAFTFEVTRSGDTSGANDVDFAVSGVADATDFGGALPSGTLNFAAGETTMTVTINVSGDTDVEADEDFTVTLSNATNGASIPAAGDSADGTIQNDDVVTPTFTIAAVNAVQAEGDGGTTAFTFEVTRAGDTSVANDVDYAVSGDVDAADFGGTLPSGTLNFAAGETTQTITLDVSGDTDVEADEDFTVELSNPTNGAELGAASSADGTIQNDDAPPTITIWLNEFHYDNTGGDVNEFVEVAGPAGTDLTGASIVLYNGSNGTAYDTIALSGIIDNEDGTNGALSFAPSSSIQNGAPDGIALVNTDGSVIEFISYEGTLTATDGPANGMTSTEVADAAGPVSEPGTDDPGLSIQRPTNAAGSLWAAPSAESPGDLNSVVAPTFAISAVNAVQAEGDAGTTAFTFEVTRTGDTSGANDVDYAVSSAVADATDFGGALPSGTLNFAAGDATMTVTINVSGDTDVEADEDFTVTLSNATNGASIPAAGDSADGTIQNDDVVTPTFTIAAVNAVQAEGDGGTTAFTFEVTRAGDTSVANDVDYAVSGDVDAADFGGTLPSGTLNFAAGETTQTITLDVSGDTDVEADEDFTVELSNPTNGAELGAASSADGTIQNDDAPPAITIWLNEFHYDNEGVDMGEFVEIAGAAGTDLGGASIVLYTGSNGTAYNTIALSGTIDDEGMGAGALSFATGIQNGSPDGVALVNTDGSIIEFISYEGTFTAVDGPAMGMTSTEIVDINGNPVTETGTEMPGNSLQRLSNSAGSAWSGPIMDSPGDLNFFAPDFMIKMVASVMAEGDSGSTPFTFEVSRMGDLSRADSVDYAIVGGAADAADFGGVLPSGTINFDVGETTKTLTINVSGDIDVEPNELFTVGLSNPSNGGTVSMPVADGMIQNDDQETAFEIAAVNAVQNEGNMGTTPFTFEVTRTGDVTGNNDVDFVVSSSATDADDFGGAIPSGTVTFSAGETAKTITIDVTGDTMFEMDETFEVKLTNPTGGATIAIPSASGTIQNDDVMALAGDFDMDGDVDTADMNILNTNWTGSQMEGDPSITFADGDADGDGDVDSMDAMIVMQSWTGAMMGGGMPGTDSVDDREEEEKKKKKKSPMDDIFADTGSVDEILSKWN